MHRNEILFSLTQTESMVLVLEESLTEVHCCYEAPVFFRGKEGEFLLSDDTVRHHMYKLVSLLTKSLSNGLLCHKSLHLNIGSLFTRYRFYSFDQDMAEKQGLIFDEEDEWVGTKHLLFAYDIAVWIYNDQQSAIILEFTPWYKGNYFDFEGETDFTQYEQFLKDYKPLFTRTLPRDVAQQWLDQANSILKQITENSERFEKEGQRQGIN
jgi:hypothetical protein